MSDAPKSVGLSTSEGKLTAIAAALIALVPLFWSKAAETVTPEVQAQLIAAIVGIYTVGRSVVKAFQKPAA